LGTAMTLDDAAERFTGAMDTLHNSRAADRYRAEEPAKAIEVRKEAAVTGSNLLAVLRSPHANEVDKETALVQLLELAAAGPAYDEAIASGDPIRMLTARERFEYIQSNLGPPPATARMVSLGVPDSSASTPVESNSVMAFLQSVEGTGLARASSIADWTDKEFKA